MTFKQWIEHLRIWRIDLLGFPLPWRDLHTYVGLADGDKLYCIVCRHEIDRENG